MNAIVKFLRIGAMSFMVALLGFILILNVFGDLAAGVWLAVLGEWGTLLQALVLLVLTTWLMPLAIAPSALLFLLAGLAWRRAGILAFPLILMGNLYVVAVATAWCVAVVSWFLFSRATTENFWPVLLLSNGVVVGPFCWMASEDNSKASLLTVFFVQLGYLLAMLSLLFSFSSPTMAGFVRVFVGTMLVGVLVMYSNVWRRLKAERSRGDAPPARTTPPPTTARIQCWRCKRPISLSNEMLGTKINCPGCGQILTLPRMMPA